MCSKPRSDAVEVRRVTELIATTEYPERLVAFIDILGFRNKIRAVDTNAGLFKQLTLIQEIAKFVTDARNTVAGTYGKVEVSYFSDSIVLSTGTSFDELAELMLQSIGLCRLLLCADALTRGGISHGKLYHQGRSVFGQGLIEAYDLEQQLAYYPRVVVKSQLAQRWRQELKGKRYLDMETLIVCDPHPQPLMCTATCLRGVTTVPQHRLMLHSHEHWPNSQHKNKKDILPLTGRWQTGGRIARFASPFGLSN